MKTVLLGAMLVAPLASIARAQEWAAQFPPHADCQLRSQTQATPEHQGPSRPATLVVRPVSFGTEDPIRQALVGLSRLGEANPAAGRPAWSPDTATVHVFDGLAPGRYLLVVRVIGYYERSDTVTVRPNAVDTLRAPVAFFHDGFRNRFNCRPRGFRRAGERACVRDGDQVEAQLIQARSLALPERRKALDLPLVDSKDVELIVDERLCERAAQAYGEVGDPPRRVILVRIGQLYVVYDPFEPLEAGEWDLHKIFDHKWQLLVALAS